MAPSTQTFASLADRVQEQIGIPYVLLDGAFDRIAASIRTIGALTGERERAEALARYAESTVEEITRRVAAIPQAKRPRVYYARGPRGLDTGLAGSINMESIERVGATNVAAELGRGGLVQVSLEQVLRWDPEVIVTTDPNFEASVRARSVVARHRRGQSGPRASCAGACRSAGSTFPRRSTGWSGCAGFRACCIPKRSPRTCVRSCASSTPASTTRRRRRRSSMRCSRPLSRAATRDRTLVRWPLVVASAVLFVAVLAAFAIGRYPVASGRACDRALVARSPAPPTAFRRRSKRSSSACAVRACWQRSRSAQHSRSPVRRTRSLFRNPLVVARHPRRLGGRGRRRGARHLPVAAGRDHPGARVRRRACRRCAGLRDRGRRSRSRPAARAGARGRGDRRARRCGDRTREVSRRSLQPAAGDHVLAARQPCIGHRRRPRFRAAGDRGRLDPAGAVALAGQRARRSATRKRARSASNRTRVRVAVIAGCDADDRSRGVDRRHRRLDRPAHPASRAPARRPGLRALAADVGRARRRVPACRRHARAHALRASRFRSAC